MNDLMGNGDLLGDDLLGAEADILGAVKAALAKRAGRPIARRVFSRPPLSPVPAYPDSKIRSYMGMGTLTWLIADGAGIIKSLTIEPQESFRGERLVLSLSPAVEVPNFTLERIEVGTQPQSPSVEAGAPVAMFASDTTYSGLDLQVAQRGTKLKISLRNTLVVSATTIVTAGFYGEWIR